MMRLLFDQIIMQPLLAFASSMEILGQKMNGMQKIDGMVSRIVHTLSRTPDSRSGLEREATISITKGDHGHGKETTLKGSSVSNQRIASAQIDQGRSAALTNQDHSILQRAEKALADGLALKRWWEQTDSTNGYAERFELVQQFNQPDTSFGFFDQALLDGQTLPVMGTVEDSLYDQPKQAASEKVRDEFREFVLRHFIRISDYRQPDAYAERRCYVPPDYLRGLSWCPEREAQRIGFGFSQHYYKLRDSGLVGKFRSREEFAIVDLREIGEKYEWIVLKVRIFNFNFTFRLLGSDQAQLAVPLKEETYLVLNRDFILNEDNPEPGVLGKYGFGYAFIRNPTEGLFAYGPGEFDAAIELINFYVLESGETRAHLVFVVNRPERILNASISPVDWTFRLADLMSFGLASTLFAPVKTVLDRFPLRISGLDPLSAYISLANQLTGGLAAEDLCISRKQLEKDFLVQHFVQHYQMIVGSLLTWRQIRDWLDSARLPEWVLTGRSS
jgi:hypothetical protein